MKLTRLLTLSLLAGLTFTSCSKDETELNNTDKNFLLNASVSHTAEIDAANLALTKSTNAVIRDYAQQMLNEHTVAHVDLKSLASTVGYPVGDTLTPTHVAIRTRLFSLSGRQFDSAYIHSQVNDHEVAMLNYRNEQHKGQHRDVRNYADTYLPHLRLHFEKADSIAFAHFR